MGLFSDLIKIIEMEVPQHKTEFEETEEYLQELESEVKKDISEFDSKNGNPRQASKPDI